MPGLIAGLALLFLNFGLMAAILALSPTPRRTPMMPASTDRCFVCSASELETTVSDYPVCSTCKDEYFDAVQ